MFVFFLFCVDPTKVLAFFNYFFVIFSENRNPLQNSQLTNQMASHREHHKV